MISVNGIWTLISHLTLTWIEGNDFALNEDQGKNVKPRSTSLLDFHNMLVFETEYW